MKHFVVSVRDAKAETFGPPLYFVNKGSALRAFSDEVNRRDAKGAMQEHFEDFDLHELGTYDDNNGLFTTGVPQLLTRGLDVRIKQG